MKIADLQKIDEEVSHILLQHHISRKLGFLGQNPLIHLPYNSSDIWCNDYFRKLDTLIYELPKHIASYTLLKEVIHLSIPPRLYLEKLSWAAQNRFMLVNGMLTHAYFVLALHYRNVSELQKDVAIKFLPPNLAVPMWEIAKLTGFAPTLSYGLYGPWNYTLKYPNEPISLDNLELLHSFTDSTDENWFVMIHHMVEKTFAPAIPALLKAVLLTADPSTKGIAQEVTRLLGDAAGALENTVYVLTRMREHCDPNTYFSRVRMFYSFPRNVVYLGVTEVAGVPQEFFGETGGQSPFMHFLLAALGIYHSDPYFPKMRQHMSKYNRNFVEFVLGSNLGEYVKKHKKYRPLLRNYKILGNFVLGWRKEHKSLANEYIEKHGEGHGTGSTPLAWLQKLHDETEQYMREL